MRFIKDLEQNRELMDEIGENICGFCKTSFPNVDDVATRFSFSGHGTSDVLIRVVINSSTAANFCLTQVSGCGAILLLHTLEIAEKYRGHQLGTQLQKWAEVIAKKTGYSKLMATTVSDNHAENRILSKLGWYRITSFDNQRNGHYISVWFKDIK